MKRFIIIGALLACFLFGGVIAVRAWRKAVMARLEEQAFSRATLLVKAGAPLGALACIDEEPRSDLRLAWSKLEFEAMVAARHIPRLVSAYGRDPKRVLAHEEASLLVARALVAARQRDGFTQLRDHWRGRELRQEWWLALDADLLGFDGKPREAEALLRSRKFEGEPESTRLVRLALLAAGRSLQESWALLDRAYELAPRNPEIRSFRAQILESINKSAQARVEYVSAHVADPKNPLLRDDLAEFYRRQGDYDLALRTWRDALALPAPDFIAVKEAFWSRLIQSGATPASRSKVQGSLAPLAEFINTLPSGCMWDAEAFGRLPQGERFARERAEVFWLQLIELLRTGGEKEATALLRENRFRDRSWRPDLETALSRILHFRRQGSLAALGVASTPGATNSHPFFQELERLSKAERVGGKATSVPADLTAFLNSGNAFAAAFLAAGWREAALSLAPPRVAEPVPIWFAYGWAQCLRYNRGNRIALESLSGQPSADEIIGLRGELMWAEKRLPEAFAELESIATHDSDSGQRAAWLLALGFIESNDLNRARRVIQGQRRLALSASGRALLARIALLSGSAGEAERMYQAIADESIEAGTFSARRAFERREWDAARRHTEALMKRLPDELQLRENLLAIDNAQRAHASH